MELDSNKKNVPTKKIKCPHCGTSAKFYLEIPRIDNELTDQSKDKRWLQATYSSKEDYNYILYEYTIWRCDICEKLVFRAIKIRRGFGGDIKLVYQYPNQMYSEFSFRDFLPPDVLEDFDSGVKCYEFEEYRAAAAMLRRSLQVSVLEKGADKKKILMDQLNELHDANPNIFTLELTDWAQKIRVFCNWGVHPQNDNLKEVNKETVDFILDFLKQYFTQVYKMPKDKEEAQKKFDEANRSPKTED